MSQSARELAAQWWSEAWTAGLWSAAWSKSLDGLSGAQAAWIPPQPAGSRGTHSIWQIVLHMIFWRESWLRRAATGVRPTEQQIAQDNFPSVHDTSDAAWAAVRARFERTQEAVAALLVQPGDAADSLRYFIPHDCYHFGQINTLRALLGLKAIE